MHLLLGKRMKATKLIYLFLWSSSEFANLSRGLGFSVHRSRRLEFVRMQAVFLTLLTFCCLRARGMCFRHLLTHTSQQAFTCIACASHSLCWFHISVLAATEC